MLRSALTAAHTHTARPTLPPCEPDLNRMEVSCPASMRSRFSDTSFRFWPICGQAGGGNARRADDIFAVALWKGGRVHTRGRRPVHPARAHTAPAQLRPRPRQGAACPQTHSIVHAYPPTRACTVVGAPISFVSCRYCTVRVLTAAAWCRARDSALQWVGRRRRKWAEHPAQAATTARAHHAVHTWYL